MKITKEILKQIIEEECKAVMDEFKMPDTQFDLGLDDEQEETEKITPPFVYKPDPATAQNFLLQQFQKPMR